MKKKSYSYMTQNNHCKPRSSTQLCILGFSSQYEDQYPPIFSGPTPHTPHFLEGNYKGTLHLLFK